jgi:hypothetical protein
LTEAASADEFLRDRSDSPIAPYVQLFAGHRKLCAVSGVEGVDPRSERAAGIARDADAQLIAAGNPGHPLLRIVADYLVTSRKCHER